MGVWYSGGNVVGSYLHVGALHSIICISKWVQVATCTLDQWLITTLKFKKDYEDSDSSLHKFNLSQLKKNYIDLIYKFFFLRNMSGVETSIATKLKLSQIYY